MTTPHVRQVCVSSRKVSVSSSSTLNYNSHLVSFHLIIGRTITTNPSVDTPISIIEGRRQGDPRLEDDQGSFGVVILFWSDETPTQDKMFTVPARPGSAWRAHRNHPLAVEVEGPGH